MTEGASAWNPVLHSGPRITIMTRLVIHKTMRFNELQKSTELSGGNLATHLNVLAGSGYVTLERKENAVSPQKFVRLTQKGEEEFRLYIRMLKVLISNVEQTHDP